MRPWQVAPHLGKWAVWETGTGRLVAVVENPDDARLIGAGPEVLSALRMAVDHLDEACCEGFAANNAPQRQRIHALLARIEGKSTPPASPPPAEPTP
jgi:hypothetical protein